MSIEIRIPPYLRNKTEGKGDVSVNGETVGDALRFLIERFSGIESDLFSRNGKLHRHIDIFVNDQSAYPNELAYEVKEGDVITIALMLSGG